MIEKALLMRGAFFVLLPKWIGELTYVSFAE